MRLPIRERHLARDLLRASVGRAERPFKLTLALTYRCNHRCLSCGIWSRKNGREMNLDELDRLFRSTRSVSWLDLTGGEIVLRADLAEIAAALHNHLDRLTLLHFPTNGLLPEPAVRAACLLHRRGGPKLIVTVSFDGPPEVHDRIRGLQGAFASAAETFRRLDAMEEVEVYAGMTLQPGNLDEVDATVTALGQVRPGFSYRDLHLNVQHVSAHYFANEGCQRADPAELADRVRRFQARKGMPRDPVGLVEWAYLRLLPRHLREGRSAIPCRSGEISAYIAPNGEVFACTIDPRPIGHLDDFDWDLRSLWQSQERSRLAAEIRSGNCVGCWTACESNQTLLSSPAQTLSAALRPAALAH